MKKIFILSIMMMVSLCLSAQNVNDLISEKTKDGAYSAPNTMLVNKKWFSFDKDLDIGVNYYFFRANKTGEYAKPTTYKDFSYEEVIPFTWSRDHNDLTISMDFKNMTYRKIVYKDPSASERTKAEIKKTVEALIEEDKKYARMIDSYVLKYYINRLDAKIFLLEGLKLELKGGGRSQTDSCDDLFLCTEVGKKDIEEKMKAKEETLQKEIEEKAEKDSTIYNTVDKMPEFNGGPSALFEYLSNNVHYPQEAKENAIQGRVLVTFVVEKDGSISNAIVVKSLDSLLDKEALRVINTMPNWKPGKNNGVAVRTKYTVPVSFKL